MFVIVDCHERTEMSTVWDIPDKDKICGKQNGNYCALLDYKGFNRN